MRTIRKEVFAFDELDDSAKDKARAWWREGVEFDSDFVLDDAVEVAALMGIAIDRKHIWWSGFWSQGDGLSFEGSYRYRSGSVAAVKAEYPRDADIHKLASNLQKVQRRAFYSLRARITQEERGHWLRVEAWDTRDHMSEDVLGAAQDDLKQIFSEFASWVYFRLEAEYEYQISDEAIDESIIANEYEFDAEGGRA